MSVQRRDLRNAIRDILRNGNTAAADRVFTNRSEAYFHDELPAIAIYTRSDPAEQRDVSPLSYYRRARIAIDIVHGTEDTGLPHDDEMDEIDEQVEALLLPRLDHLSVLFGLHQPGVQYLGLENFAATIEGEVPLSGSRLTLEFTYLQEIDPLDLAECQVLKTLHAEWELGNAVQDGPEATDDIALP